MKEIFRAIADYALAYKTIEGLQRRYEKLLPIGDQKTGVIAEFYARLLVKSDFPDAQFDYGSASQHAWDIRVQRRGLEDVLIQVKAVSCYSTKRRVSPIYSGWHELWLMLLNEKLLPEACWVFKSTEVSWAAHTLKNKTAPRPGKKNSGSVEFRSGTGRLKDLLGVINEAHHERLDNPNRSS